MNNKLNKFFKKELCAKPDALIRFAIINGKEYQIKIDNEYKIYILSKNMINSSSFLENNSYFCTYVDSSYISDIFEEFLYAKYSENIYQVCMVLGDFEKFVLLNRGFAFLDADRNLGFKFDSYIGSNILEVDTSKVELYSSRTSVYSRIMEQKSFYQQRKK